MRLNKLANPLRFLFKKINRIYAVDLSDTALNLVFLPKTFLHSTEMSEEGLSENEKRKRTDPQLLKAIPGPHLSSVLSICGEIARDQLANVLNELDDLLKHKADIAMCKIVKHRIELEPEAFPHREGARRMSRQGCESQSRSAELASFRSNSTFLLAMGERDSHGEEKIRRISLLLLLPAAE